MKQLIPLLIRRKKVSKVETKNGNLLWFPAMLFLISLASCQKETKSNNTTNDLISSSKNEKNSTPTVTTKVYATGLINPRELKFGPDGNLYVAEGGTGGSTSTIGQCTQAAGLPTGPGPYLGSTTGGRISKIDANGVRTTVNWFVSLV